MSFDKLADRCLLFIDERKHLLIELLKEAEVELTRKTNMYEATRTYTANNLETLGLPSNYKQIIFLQHDGDKLHPLSEDEVDYNSDGNIDSGTPTGYFIRNNGICLNYKTSSGVFKLSYYGTVEGYQDTATDPSPIIADNYHKDLCDYAIYVASAKLNPELSDKHFLLWNNNIQNIINEDADRELIHTIKREI